MKKFLLFGISGLLFVSLLISLASYNINLGYIAFGAVSIILGTVVIYGFIYNSIKLNKFGYVEYIDLHKRLSDNANIKDVENEILQWGKDHKGRVKIFKRENISLKGIIKISEPLVYVHIRIIRNYPNNPCMNKIRYRFPRHRRLGFDISYLNSFANYAP